jgi:hypothetical protein
VNNCSTATAVAAGIAVPTLAVPLALLITTLPLASAGSYIPLPYALGRAVACHLLQALWPDRHAAPVLCSK